MNDWLLIMGMAIVTFTPRCIPFLFAGKMTIPPLAEQALNFVPIAVLTAIITRTTLFQNEEFALNPSNTYLLAAIVAIIVAHIWKRFFLTVFSGIAAFIIATLIL